MDRLISARAGRRNRRLAALGVLDHILRRANRRHLTNLAVEHIALAAGVGAAGAILLLLVGTQIMNWYWPVLLFVAGLGVGLVRARSQRLSRYRVAQLLDERLGLQDRLSTLVWFRERETESQPLLDTVEKQALSRVRPGDADRAVPVSIPRYGYACAALVVAAAGLLAVRYGVLHTMDLGAPIARVDFDFFAPEPKVQAATKKSAIQERFEQQLKELGLNVDDLQNEKGLEPVEANIPATPEAGTQPAQPGMKPVKAPESSPEGSEGSEEGEKSDGDQGAEGAAETDSGKPQQQGKPQANAPQNAKAGQQGPQNSLMNKMKDALANLMNKMKMNQQGNEQQTAMNQPSQQQGQQQGQQGQQGQQSKSQAKDGSQSQQGQEGDQDGEGEKSAGEKSQAGDKSSDRPGSQDSKSGMGQTDGDKSIKEAEQLAAMGKISEIFGKRAQQVTGEITVEVHSGKQQLKTAWSDRKALHADTGAEVNRDEIPLAYQTYVQRYFEEVRKTAPVKTPKAGS